MHGVLSGLLIVDGLIAASQAHRLGVVLLNVLRQEADLGVLVALVVVAVNRLAVVRFANLLDVLFETLVREESAAARCGGGAAGGVAR